MLRLVVFLALFAAVVYAFFWLIERRNDGGSGGVRQPSPSRAARWAPTTTRTSCASSSCKRRHSKDKDEKVRAHSSVRTTAVGSGAA